MNFPYLFVQQSMDSINIEDIGNVSLQLINDTGQCWYLILYTNLGWTTIHSFGPMNLEDSILPYHFQYKYDLQEYDDAKLIKMIDKFINDPKKLATQIFFVDKEETLEKLRKLHERS